MPYRHKRRLPERQKREMELQENVLKRIDTEYSRELAKRMEQFRSHPVLGYRPAGSAAEFETGEFLLAEMKWIGLSGAGKDAVTVDGWEFHRASLCYRDADDREVTAQLGAYQTTLVTDGPKSYQMVFLGKGTEADYEGKDVRGKLVLVEINQRDEWWINYPVYQAHLKGAAALIAVQSGGYGEINEEALNAQDIAGPEDAPAFSISRKDAVPLTALLKERGELTVTLDADTSVKRSCTTYNITGCIPGKHPERMVLLSAHYDSYFSGFQDDNTAVAMMLGIAKALLESGLQPNNTIVICAMAAEEWGVSDSNFDWSTGAYEQVFTAHPEWAGKVIADLNFELPAMAHGTRARIRSCYEYVSFLEEYLGELPNLTRAYPEEARVTAPIETWSDDFSMAIAGIPSMVNDFTGGSFMETHYHSQFDNESFYDEQVYRLHHELFALLLLTLDETAVVPLDFTPVAERARRGLHKCRELWNGPAAHVLSAQRQELTERLEQADRLCMQLEERCRTEYERLCAYNREYRRLLRAGETERAEELYCRGRGWEKELLLQFKREQDTLVRIDWYGNVFYPHEILAKNIGLLCGAAHNLREERLSSALRKLYQVDNNAYAFMFEKQVYEHFTDYVLHQPRERLKWGYGRLLEHENLYETVRGLLEKEKTGEKDYAGEILRLEQSGAKQGAKLLAFLLQLCRTAQELLASPLSGQEDVF